MKATQKPWIETAYIIFSQEGPNGLKVEPLAKEVGKNKSSFYHHFADMEGFTEVLLAYHLEQAHIVAEKEAECKGVEELITVLVEHKIDLLFNRQLRIHREVTAFETCFTKVNAFAIHAIIPVWSNILRLQDNSYLVELVIRLSLENFFLQITAETLNPIWLKSYFDGIQSLVIQFKKTKIKTL